MFFEICDVKKFYKEYMGSLTLCHPEILHFRLAYMTLSITCKELSIAQVGKFNMFNKLFHWDNEVDFYLPCCLFYKIFILMKQRFAYLCYLTWRLIAITDIAHLDVVVVWFVMSSDSVIGHLKEM